MDSFSPIKRAEYSIDADDWQLVEPVGQISDYKIENYDFKLPIPANTDTEPGSPAEKGANNAARGAEEHTIIVRVYDRFENMGIGKVVVRAAVTPQ